MGNATITPSIPIILASASKIRSKILQKTGMEFSVIISDIDEIPDPKRIREFDIREKYACFLQKNFQSKINLLNVTDMAIILASEKALNVSKTNPNSYVIGADQICNLNNNIFSKPNTMDNAIEQLKKLSGKTHKQTSGISLYFNSKLIWSDYEEAELTMYEIKEKEIIKYLKIDKPFNSCGSYKYESLGINLFSKVTGSNETIQV